MSDTATTLQIEYDQAVYQHGADSRQAIAAELAAEQFFEKARNERRAVPSLTSSAPQLETHLTQPIQALTMKIAAMIPSSYLKQSDFDENGFIVTVSHFKQENVAPDDKPSENKWVVYFTEHPDKGMVLNTTNINLMSVACGSDETDDWKGKQVVVYVDPGISYGGKMTGGLRVRKHSAPSAPRAAQSAGRIDMPPGPY